jgi:hypothetical protein
MIKDIHKFCAYLVHSHVETSAKFLQNNAHYSSMHNSCRGLNDHYDALHANNFHHVQLTTHAELFANISPIECLCYTMLDKHVEIDQMLEKNSMLTSMGSLNNVHSCKFTFNFIVEYVIDKLFVGVICTMLWR